ncbi:SusD/RagB family nutrient-binding outer membrane lipoprotein [Hymenobacter glacialis]|uniref:SusD/RagB family nutrient-binding outer membrane lipoprotein n=1 Tax=Hymenobacter glacialis TaxID=1908236 RepID=A0A1G1T4F6_9BACT|nr:SusD/RagB family nutrient-binding outer membrane lipoprotein [Hymenobacter glacialis]OGX85751.1 hypothetical protein BEN48_14210 [Hymenobacter glacialis]
MITKKYLLGLGLLLGGSALTACEKFLDVNTNPNNPTVATPNFILPGIISNGIQTQMFSALRVNYITQYIVNRTPTSANDQYFFTNAQSTNTFNFSYFQSGGNIPGMVKAAEEEGSSYFVGAGKIMQAMILAHLTDMLGDVPFSEAYQGGANFTPKYDPQEKLYGDINRLCDEGVVEMAKPASSQKRPFYSTSPSESGDILYKGDPGKWTRLAYALKARQAQHLTKKASYDPAAVQALCALAFRSSADDAQLQFQTPVAPLVNTTNIFGITRSNFGGATFSTNLINYLNGTTFTGVVDPRFGVIAPTTSTGGRPGVTTPAGTNVAPGSTTTTDFYASWYARDLGYYEVITYHEVKFIEAEAAFRAGNTAKALASLQEGVRAHMRKIGAGGTFAPPTVTFPVITEAQITAYLASAAMPQTATAVTLRSIMEQKYIAMFLNPDSWSDLRRLDFDPATYVNFLYPVGANSIVSGQADPTRRYPRRLLPGATEVTANPNEVARVGGNEPDYITRPLWFDMP